MQYPAITLYNCVAPAKMMGVHGNEHLSVRGEANKRIIEPVRLVAQRCHGCAKSYFIVNTAQAHAALSLAWRWVV
jgi:hypothetical protein